MVWRCAPTLVFVGACFSKPSPPHQLDAAGSDRDAQIADSGDASPAAWIGDYVYRRRITITRPTAPPGILDDYPVSVVIENDQALRDNVMADTQLVFTDESGGVLAYEIVKFATLTGSLEAWVKLPSLPVGTTPIYLYYGGTATVPMSTDVWTRARGVWHMNRSSVSEQDSSGNITDLSASDVALAPQPTAGIVGNGRDYDGTTQYLCHPNNPFSVDAAPFSYSVWVQPRNDNNTDNSPIRYFSNGGSGFWLRLDTTWAAVLTDTNNTATALLGAQTSQWVQLAVTVQHTSTVGIVSTYRNGTLVDQTPFTMLGAISAADRFCLGDSVGLFSGKLDEARVYTALQSQAWFAIEYLNLDPASRASFINIGPEEMKP